MDEQEILARAEREHRILFAAAISAAGGKLEIGDSHFINAPDMTVKSWRDEANKRTVFEIATPQPGNKPDPA